MICDFCSSPAPTWCCPAESFRDQFGGFSTGAWLACEECHVLIEAGNRTALARRADAIAVRYGVDPELARAYSLALHRGFFGHRTGEARRWP